MDAVRPLREGIEAWFRERGEARLQASGPDPAGPPRPAKHAWIATEDAVRRIRRASQEHRITPVERAALARHVTLARFGQDYVRLDPVNGRAEAFSFEATLSDLQPDEAEARLGAPLAEDAGAFLERTHDLVPEAYRVLVPAGQPPPRTGAEFAELWVQPRCERVFPPAGRWRRLAEGLSALRLDRVFDRMRGEDRPFSMGPYGSLVALEVPLDIRVAPPGWEMGLASELAAAETLGRGLALAASAPALPSELRWPPLGTVGRALGTLFAHLCVDPVFLRRVRGLTNDEVASVARRGSALLGGEVALQAVRVLLQEAERAEAGTSRGRAEEQADGWAERTLSVEQGAALALAGWPWVTPAILRSRLGGLRLAVGFRERFDEDWFLNPRSAEVIRAACESGGALAVEAFCEELGVDQELPESRLLEGLDSSMT